MKRKIIIFGAANYGRKAFEMLHINHQIVCVADNNPKLYGTEICGASVVSIDQLKEFYAVDTDIVIATVHHVEVAEQIKETITDIKDYFVMLNGHLYNGCFWMVGFILSGIFGISMGATGSGSTC